MAIVMMFVKKPLTVPCPPHYAVEISLPDGWGGGDDVKLVYVDAWSG